MTLYEGIALIQEKQAVILDLGYDYTKFGFAGEVAPRAVIRSEMYNADKKAMRRLHDYTTTDELYNNLVDMLHVIYFRHLLISPKERRAIVIESLLTPSAFRETLAKVLYTHYEVPSVVWADSARLCSAALATPVLLVSELGAREAEVTPTAHGTPLTWAVQSQPIGARAVLERLKDLLDEENGKALDLPMHVLEDIRVKTCFVTSRERAEAWLSDAPPTQTPPAVQWRERGRSPLVVGGRSRELATEVMFARDEEMSSLPDIILQAIIQSPLDLRRQLAENILLTGGGSELPGLRSRLLSELRYLVAQPEYKDRLSVDTFKIHCPPIPGNITAWVGASAIGPGDALASRALPRDKYLANMHVPDWVCLIDNTAPSTKRVSYAA